MATAMSTLLLKAPMTFSAPIPTFPPISSSAPMMMFSPKAPVDPTILLALYGVSHIIRHQFPPKRKHSSRFKTSSSFSYNHPPPSSTCPLSLRLSSKHATLPISPVLKEDKGLRGINWNSSASWASSFWDDQVFKTDKKLPNTTSVKFPCLCCSASKEASSTTLTETKDDTHAEAKRKVNKTGRWSDRKQSRRKIYTVLAGASFCVVLLLAFKLPNRRPLFKLLTKQLSFESMKRKCFEILWYASHHIMYFSSAWCHVFLEKSKFGFYKMNIKPIKQQSIYFDDVEGVDAAKAELREIVSCIQGDSNYVKLGVKLPRGVLLVGPPGTGKTLLARAVAGEADMPFFSISSSEFVEVFPGVGASRVRDLFREARKRSPSIIFIDEIDAVGGQRGISFNSEKDQTLNQLLVEMDGFEKDDAKVVLIAATNSPEILDSALLRSGRFSRKVFVGEPDEDGRRKIFGLYLRDVPMEEDKQVICDLVASLTPRLVGADLENIANESRCLAARRGGHFVSKEDVLQAVERAKQKICNNNIATDAKSPYLFGEKALERVQCTGTTMGY